MGLKLNKIFLYKRFLFAFFILTVVCQGALIAQDSINNSIHYIDKTDLINIIRGEKSKKKSTGIPEKGKLIAFAAPIFGANPSMGTFFGLGGTGAIYFGEPENTSISNFNTSALYTTKNQLVVTIKGTVMTPENLWEMLFDVKYSIFSEGTYGLGSDYNQPVNEGWNIGGIHTEGIEGVQQLDYNYFKLHYTLLRETYNHLYFGLGYHLDLHTKIFDESLDLEAPNPVITSHYFYTVAKGFDVNEYTSSGISFNAVYDSRDHTVNPYKGSFSQVSYRVNPEFLGSSHDYQQLYLETRLYQSLSKKIPRHLVSLWVIGQFITSGDAPYLDLPASSYDMRNRIGRGYIAARFRGENWVSAETEYRFPVTKNGLIGGVLFASITSTSREESQIGDTYYDKLKLFEAIRPAGGFGARVLLNRTGRLNLTMDMAFGQNGSKGFYVAVGETF